MTNLACEINQATRDAEALARAEEACRDFNSFVGSEVATPSRCPACGGWGVALPEIGRVRPEAIVKPRDHAEHMRADGARRFVQRAFSL